MVELSQASVIIPVHNRADLLRECLQSVARQTFRLLEVIVVDDASDEEISSVVESIAWPDGMTARCLRSQQNVGPGAAREIGRRAAQGEYIAYLDSDDLWHPDKLAEQVAALRGMPGAGMCYCVSREFATLPLTGDEPLRKGSDQAVDAFLPTILDIRPWGTGACLWTRAASDKIGSWFPGWCWEDYEYDCRAGCKEISIVHVPRVLCYYRRGPATSGITTGTAPLTILRQKALALFEMAAQLRQHGCLRDADIRRRLVRNLIDRGVSLLARGEQSVARRCLWLAWRTAHTHTAMGQTAALLLLTQWIFGPVNAARLGWRLQRQLYRKFQGPEKQFVPIHKSRLLTDR